MKIIKYILGIIVLTFFCLLSLQNEILSQKASFVINIYFKEFHTPNLYLWLYIILFFISGFILSYIFYISKKIKSKIEIKKLNQTVNNHIKTITTLKNELDVLKHDTSNIDQTVTENTETQIDSKNISNNDIADNK